MESFVDVPMEDIDEEVGEDTVAEEDIKADTSHDSTIEVVRATPGTRVSQGRKRTTTSHKAGTSYGTSSKKAKAKSSVLIALQAQLAYNKHFYTKKGELRMMELVGKPIMSEKKVSQKTLPNTIV